MPNPNEHIEPHTDFLNAPDPGVLAAVEAALDTPAVDPQPGDALPPPDSAPKVPEGTGESDPADNAPQPDAPKPDEHKTVEPTDPDAAAPAVEPATDADGPQKRPSDEFGELPADAPVKTRERFETMRTKYDEVHARVETEAKRAEAAEALANDWTATVQSTGATPDQFGMTLDYLKAVNSGTPEGLQRAFDMMQNELATLATAMGREVPGIYDPLAAHADLMAEVDDETLSRDRALEIAAARNRQTQSAEAQTSNSNEVQLQQRVDAGLAAVTQLGNTLRTQPGYDALTKALTPTIERVVANLPPEQWADAIRDLYAGAAAIRPAPVASATPSVDTPAPLRNTASPGTGAGLSKTPGSALEAMEMSLGIR